MAEEVVAEEAEAEEAGFMLFMHCEAASDPCPATPQFNKLWNITGTRIHMKARGGEPWAQGSMIPGSNYSAQVPLPSLPPSPSPFSHSHADCADVSRCRTTTLVSRFPASKRHLETLGKARDGALH